VYKITIITLGKFKEQAFVDLEAEYLKRLKQFAKIKIIELPEVSYHDSREIPKVKLRESELIRKAIPKNCIVVLLREVGFEKNSVDFSEFLDRLGSLGNEIVFVIGSGVGLDDSLKDVANHTISLSKLTFTHNFARVLLEEQIYRACAIISGKEYHK
jgi:23S rRNA (pseudouridine1915-N3)-methyltransferase